MTSEASVVDPTDVVTMFESIMDNIDATIDDVVDHVVTNVVSMQAK